MKHFVKIISFLLVAIFSFYDCSNSHIKETRVFVQDIKKISQLATITYITDIIMNETWHYEEPRKFIFSWTKSFDYQIVEVATIRLKAGFDLQDITENDVKIENNILYIHLPKPKILNADMDSQDVRVYYEDEKNGNWDSKNIFEKRNQMHKRYLEKAKQDAIKSGVLKRTSEEAQKRLVPIFKTMGFDDVVIEIKK